MDQILTAILKETYTLSSLKHRLRTLRGRLQAQFFGSALPNEDPQDIKWLNSLGDVTQQFNQKNLSQTLSKLEDFALNTTPLILYLPFEVDDKQIGELGAWIRANLGSQILLEIKFDPNLIAGCATSYKGVYRDYSLKTQIDAKKDQILANFRQYLK